MLMAGWQVPVMPAVSFSLMSGEVLGLTGPNGAGKSTLLAAIAGRARIFSGALSRQAGARVRLHGQDALPLQGLPLSGRELLALAGASPEGLPAWLAGRVDQRLDRLSGGQRHTFALWAVLAAPAEIVLLDEPTNHLDREGSAHLVGALQDKKRTGAGILLVSHDHELIEAACDRVIALAEGVQDD